MPKLFRAMLATGGLPLVGTERNMLGVRPGEIEVDDDNVCLEAGGMSVNVCLCGIPPLILPRHLSLSRIVRGAKGDDDRREGFHMGEGPFVQSPVADRLRLRPGNHKHGFVEPDRVMPLTEYQEALAATQNQWHVVTKANNDCPRCKTSFLEYVRLLVDVQAAIRRNDEQSATLLRRQSEELGDDLSPEEIEWLYGLSGDLDMLTGEEVFERPTLPPRQLLLKLKSATDRLDGQAMLEVLRQNPSLLLPQQKAYLRANAYDHLGYTELSLLFMRHAAELAPEDDQYPCLILEKLARLGRLEEARALALVSLARPTLSEDLIIFSSGAIFSSTRDMDDEAAQPLCAKVTEALERGVSK